MLPHKLKFKRIFFPYLSLFISQAAVYLFLLTFNLSAFANQLDNADDNLLMPFYINESFTGDLTEIRQRKILRALVTYGKSDFYLDNGAMSGIQVELLKLYEKQLNKGVRREVDKVKIQIIPVQFDQLIDSLLEGKGDVAAAFLTATKDRQEKVKFALGNLNNVDEILVSNKLQPEVTSWSDLSGETIFVLRGSSYVEHLKGLNLNLALKGKKAIIIREADAELLSEDLLELVNAGVMPRTVIDDYKAELWAKIYPNIRLDKQLTVRDGSALGWAVRPDSTELLSSLQTFVKKQVRPGTLNGNILFNRYFKHSAWISQLESDDYRRRFKHLAPLFKKYAQDYDFNHLALIAQGFQESYLDNSKVSHRGAQGIMQVLPSTAKSVGISNLKDPEQNILAGTRYLAWLRENYVNQEGISATDEMALLWAGYNAGPGNLRKMRKLTSQMGLDPNRWFGHVELAAARIIGRETVQYVSNIYKYYVVYTLSQELELEKHELPSG